MGAGHAYQYEHFMLLNLGEMEEFEREEFLEDLKHTLEIHNYGSHTHEGRGAIHLGETKQSDDTLYLGVDYSGGRPCLFVEFQYGEDESQDYEADYGESFSVYEERNTKMVNNAFNQLIRFYPDNTFSFASSAWTSGFYTKERLYANEEEA